MTKCISEGYFEKFNKPAAGYKIKSGERSHVPLERSKIMGHSRVVVSNRTFFNVENVLHLLSLVWVTTKPHVAIEHLTCG